MAEEAEGAAEEGSAEDGEKSGGGKKKLIIIAAIAVFLTAPTAKIPFCEETNKWFKEEELSPFQIIGDWQAIVNVLEAGNEEVFDAIEKSPNPKEESHSVFTIYSSEVGKHYLAVENKVASLNDKNEIEFEDVPVVEFISISESLKQKLMNGGRSSTETSGKNA